VVKKGEEVVRSGEAIGFDEEDVEQVHKDIAPG